VLCATGVLPLFCPSAKSVSLKQIAFESVVIYVFVALLAFLVSLILTGVLRLQALARVRSFHAVPMSRRGGVAMVVGMY